MKRIPIFPSLSRPRISEPPITEATSPAPIDDEKHRPILARSHYVGLGESITIRAQPASPHSQPWGFIPLEIGIVSAEEQGLQAVSVRDDRAGNPLALDREELSQPVDRGDDVSVNQRVVSG